MTQEKPTQQPDAENKATTPLVESILADKSKDSMDVDLAQLSSEIAKITDVNQLGEMKTWVDGQLTAVTAQATELTDMASTATAASAKILETSAKQFKAQAEKLKQTLSKIDFRTAELQLREPFSPENLFNAFESAQKTGDMTTWNLEIAKMMLKIKADVLAEGGAPAPKPATTEKPKPKAATTPEKAKTTGKKEKGAKITDEALAEAVKTIEEYVKDHPDTNLTYGFTYMKKLTGTIGVGGMARNSIVSMAEKIADAIETGKRRTEMQPVTDALAKDKIEDVSTLLSKAPKVKGEKRLDIGEMATKHKKEWLELKAQILFMSEDLHLVDRPTWINKFDDVDALSAMLDNTRALAASKPAIVLKYYSSEKLMNLIKDVLPRIYKQPEPAATPDVTPVQTTAAVDRAPQRPAAPPKPEAKPASPTPEATQARVMTALELATAMGFKQADLDQASGDMSRMATTQLDRFQTRGIEFSELTADEKKYLLPIVKAGDEAGLKKLQAYISAKKST